MGTCNIARLLSIGIAVLMAIGACGSPPVDDEVIPDIPGPKPGQQLPDYAAFTLKGDTVSLDSFRGDVVLLNFWATWCGPCIAELPELKTLEEELGNQGLRIITVSLDRDDRAEAAEYLAVHGFGWLNLFDDRTKVNGIFGWEDGIPKTILINRDGTIRIWWKGRLDPAIARNRKLIDAAIQDRNWQGA